VVIWINIVPYTWKRKTLSVNFPPRNLPSIWIRPNIELLISDKLAKVWANGQSGDQLSSAAPAVARKGRGEKRRNPEPEKGALLTSTVDEQEDENHAAVLYHIVGTGDETQDDQGTKVSYVTLSDGDIIIEIWICQSMLGVCHFGFWLFLLHRFKWWVQVCTFVMMLQIIE
jgi:hypothetical protein